MKLSSDPVSESAQKGRALETAVRFIQQTILKSDPKLEGTQFSVEVNKIVTLSGVRHEIDILVKTLPDSQYETTWVFECKNWRKAVGKNEVIVLAEKVDAIRANRGFLVARKFSKHAEAQSQIDNRLSLIPCTDQFLSPLDNVELALTVPEPHAVQVLIKERGVPPTEHPNEVGWKGKLCSLNKQLVDFPSFVKRHIDQRILQVQKELAGEDRVQGKQSDQWCGARIEFGDGEFIFDGLEVEWMTLEARYTTTIHKRKLLSKFELKGHGRAFSFEPIDGVIRGKRLEVVMVQRI